MKKGKIFKTLAIFGTCLCAPLLLSGCGQNNDNINFRVENGYVQYTKDGKDWENLIAVDDLKGEDGANGTVVSIGNDGYWYINGVKTDNKAVAVDGADGNGIKSITIDDTKTNETKTTYLITFDDDTTYSFEVKNGTNGTDGDDGANGSIVTIGADGYWYIDNVKTNVKAEGKGGTNGDDGSVVTIGEDGFWYIDGIKTDVKAKGEDGIDGLTPYIGDNGNWWIGTTDTGVVAQHEKITITLSYDTTVNFVDSDIEKVSASGTKFNSILKCNYGETITLPIVSNSFGYEFEGWYSTTNGEVTVNDDKVTNMTAFTKDVTLVPKFKGYESNHQVERDGVIYSYESLTTIKDITFTGEDSGVINIPYGTTGVILSETSTFNRNEYTLTIPTTMFNNTVVTFYDSHNIILPKVKTLNIECESTTSEIELIDMYQFESVKEINVSGVVTSIGTGAFEDFTNLKCLKDSTSTTSSNNVVELNKCTFIGSSAFENSSISEIIITFDCEQPCSIAGDAFKNCTSLVNAIITGRGEYEISIVNNIFEGCTNLMQVGISRVSTNVSLPAPTLEGYEWNIYDGQHNLLELGVTEIEKGQEYKIYEQDLSSN